MHFKWSWCEYCDAPMIICPQCGNNSCNGHFECEMCQEVANFEDGEYDTGKYPKTKEDVERLNNLNIL